MWFYLFTTHDTFPDPLEEIDALAALDEEGEGAYLRLTPRPDAPLRGAAPRRASPPLHQERRGVVYLGARGGRGAGPAGPDTAVRAAPLVGI